MIRQNTIKIIITIVLAAPFLLPANTHAIPPCIRIAQRVARDLIHTSPHRSYSSIASIQRNPQIWPKLHNQGEGTTIAVIDSGIESHPDIASRIIGFKDFVYGHTLPYDDDGHGTHCAGSIAGNGTLSGGLYHGIAPKASLVGVKIISIEGKSHPILLAHAIQWCTKNKNHYNIKVISISMGFEHSSEIDFHYPENRHCIDMIYEEIEYAHQNNIVLVASAGNNRGEGVIKIPGNHPAIITVGATNGQSIPSAESHVADFSNWGTLSIGSNKPDVVAPGVDVISLRSEASSLPALDSTDPILKNYAMMTGTSAATPIVAGVAALIISENPSITSDAVKRRLQKAADPLAETPGVQGAGQINTVNSLINPITIDSLYMKSSS